MYYSSNIAAFLLQTNIFYWIGFSSLPCENIFVPSVLRRSRNILEEKNMEEKEKNVLLFFYHKMHIFSTQNHVSVFSVLLTVAFEMVINFYRHTWHESTIIVSPHRRPFFFIGLNQKWGQIKIKNKEKITILNVDKNCQTRTLKHFLQRM